MKGLLTLMMIVLLCVIAAAVYKLYKNLKSTDREESAREAFLQALCEETARKKRESENTAENIEGDYCLCERKISDNTAYLTAECKLDGKTLYFEDTLKTDIENFDGECEISLCSMVFKALSQLTDKKVGWGTLTGVRPVKRVNNMLAEGMNENEIKSELKRRFSVSEEKSEIACLTAKTQQDIVRKIDDKNRRQNIVSLTSKGKQTLGSIPAFFKTSMASSSDVTLTIFAINFDFFSTISAEDNSSIV